MRRIGDSTFGTSAQGQFVLVSVENIGDEPQTPFEEIDPGNKITGST